MSLENQIASLVAAANALTTAVNGKIAQIDQKNNAFVASFDANLKAALAKTFYVNASTGLDSNPGTQSSPKKTIAGALSLAPSGSTVNVYLAGDNTYPVSNIWVQGVNVNIVKWNGASRPIIVPVSTEYDDGQTNAIGFRPYASRFTFQDCTLDTGDFLEGRATSSIWSGLFARGDLTNAYIFLFNCELILRAFPLLVIPSGGGLYDVSMYSTKIRRAAPRGGDGSRVRLLKNESSSPLRIHWSAIALEDVKYSELIQHVTLDSSGRVTNVITPIDLAAHILAGT